MTNALNVACVVAVLLLVYALSVGPVFWLCSDEAGRIAGVSGQVFLLAYTPIIVPLQNGPKPVRQAIGWYLGLFGCQ